MIVTLTGAYRNAGDHLIGDRAHALLRAHVKDDIVNIDRKQIRSEHYDIFNQARAVLLCGGPAYQTAIFPQIYPIDRELISSPIVPYGLGWKGKIDIPPEAFRFRPEAMAFIKDIHARIEVSSARDPLAVRLLEKVGCTNVLMTGCPAWYDLETLTTPYTFKDEVRTLVFSMPFKFTPSIAKFINWLTARFPKARRIVSFHTGLVQHKTPKGYKQALMHAGFSLYAIQHGWRIASFAGSLAEMERLYRSADLHIGFRVHAHLYCLSRRIASILINEDSRGAGQALALGAPSLVFQRADLAPVQETLEAHFQSRGEVVAHSIETIRQTYPTMVRFLSTI